MQLKWLVHSGWKNGIFCFFGQVHAQKFRFAEISGEIPENSGTEVSTPLYTIELSDLFLQKKIFLVQC